jgi:acetyl esterase/lipase
VSIRTLKTVAPEKVAVLSVRRRVFSLAILICNLVAAFLGVIYLVNQTSSGVWKLLGIVFLLALMGNLFIAYRNSQNLNTEVKHGRKLKYLGYLYLIFSMLSMGGMLIGTWLTSINTLSDNLLYYLIVYVSYFGLLVIGAALSYMTLQAHGRGEVWEKGESGTVGIGIRAIRWMIQLGCLCVLGLGLLFAWIVVFAGSFGLIESLIEIMVPQFALSYAFIFIGAVLLFLQWVDARQRPLLHFSVLTIGLLVFVICLGPVSLTPYTINQAGKNFSAAFGEDWQTRIAPADAEYFRRSPFVLPAYFLGISAEDPIIKRDVLFYQGGSGVDEGIKLYFDAYLPPQNVGDLPGKNSVIIRLHGGAWVTGDKGAGNLPQMNKHLAAQGYVVFDIQYGISTIVQSPVDLGAPANVKGPFTLDDMIRHIGIFTQYLVQHAGEYGANLDSVFISGSSAGGQLTAATALGIASARYPEIFGTGLTIKGLIPFYPGNGTARNIGLDGADVFVNPEMLVDKNSPPALVFQGTHDSLVPPKIARAFADKYLEAGNKHCAVIFMLLAGHGSEGNFSGYYNQIFLYYMERFLYLYR